MASRKKSVIKEWIQALLTALIIVLFIRTFVAEVFVIPTPSMENTLVPGDFILVNKISYGARLAKTPLSIPFMHQNLPFNINVKSYLEWFSLPYFRFPGIGSIQHNDIIVFNYPLEDEFPSDHKTHYVKRCVALPGDTLEISNTQIMINRKVLASSPDLKFDHIIKTAINDQTILHDLEISEGGRAASKNELHIPLTEKEAAKLKKDKRVINIHKRTEKPKVFYDFIFPYELFLKWNSDNFGPVIIPKEGSSVILTNENIAIYKRIIENYEENELEISDNEFKINGKVEKAYTFKMNYYFMMGDNRHYSSDSRFWGFVPENHIAGKATTVLFSLNPSKSLLSKIRYKRFFKSLEL
ncbi:MAG: signal peptidase I [Bacteroidota bacterium]|nr:signal peptidase I [Bacteroidota bacterium]